MHFHSFNHSLKICQIPVVCCMPQHAGDPNRASCFRDSRSPRCLARPCVTWPTQFPQLLLPHLVPRTHNVQLPRTFLILSSVFCSLRGFLFVFWLSFKLPFTWVESQLILSKNSLCSASLVLGEIRDSLILPSQCVLSSSSEHCKVSYSLSGSC